MSIPTTAVDPGPTVPTVPLEYSPTWLPEGFTEWRRGTSPHGSERSYPRTGAPDSVASLIGFSVRQDDIATRTASLEASADRVAVRGAPGYFVGGDLHRRVREDRFLVVTTQAVPDARATALRVAESVQPDDRVVRAGVRRRLDRLHRLRPGRGGLDRLRERDAGRAPLPRLPTWPTRCGR
ncbi:hypothetical protein [Saccharothrix lopnurensis]|uniref:Uncharacterized protein n=1 Tax=Saccharothrix lopnurensis TaxID=1670621 RepID=A0ABW1P3S3_9PSEU